MATGASNAELAVILIDARKGVLTQTRRHCLIASLLGIRHVVLAVNKIDLVGLSTQARLRRDRRRLPAPSPAQLGLRLASSPSRSRRAAATTSCEPSAQHALVRRPDAARATWRPSRSTSRARRQAVPHAGAVGQPPRPRFPRLLPAPSRPARVRRGDAVAVAPSGRASTVARIVTMDGDLHEAGAGRGGHPDAGRRDRHLPRRRARRGRRAGRRSPTSSTATLIWMAREPTAARAAPTCSSSARRTVPAQRHRSSSTRSTSTRSSTWRPRPWP